MIFSEPRNLDATTALQKNDVRKLYKGLRKRSLSDVSDNPPSFSEIEDAVSEADSRKRSILVKSYNTLQRFRKWIGRKMYQKLSPRLKKIVKKIGRIEAHFHKKIVCIKPRLQRQYGRLIYPEGLTVKAIVQKKQNFFHDIINGDEEDDHVEFIEDCFEDMERPKFGWRAKVTFVEDEPCNVDIDNPGLSTCRLNSTRNVGDTAERRQTLEEFRSAAPTDCRIRYIC